MIHINECSNKIKTSAIVNQNAILTRNNSKYNSDRKTLLSSIVKT